MTTSITVKDGMFIIKGYNIKPLMLQIQSARFIPSLMAYVMPASPAGAEILRTALFNDSNYNLFCKNHKQITDHLYDHLKAQKIKTQPPNGAVLSSIKTKPWDHQKTAISYALALPATMLAISMGGGKSLAAIGVAGESNARRVLILCPKSVINVWPNQFRQHSRLKWQTFALKDGSVASRTKRLEKELSACEKLNQRAVVIINYDSVWRDPMGPFLKNAGFDLLILDESQRIKSHKGKASKYVGASLSSIPKKLALSGTPMPHSPLDIFAQYRALDPAIFGQFVTKFEKRYCIKGGYGGYQVLGWQNDQELRDRYRMISYEVAKSDCPDLPPELDEIIPVELSPKARAMYQQMEKEFYLQVDEKEITAANAMTKLMRLQQITSGFAKTEDGDIIDLGSDKLDALKDYLEDIVNEKVTIFCRFTHDIQLIKSVVEGMGRRYGELSGQRNDLTEDATYPHDVDILVVQIQSGGVGIDLSLSSVGIYYSLGLSLGDYLQSRARLHRPGQKNRVLFAHFLAEKTIDQKGYKALIKRQDLIKYIMENR